MDLAKEVTCRQTYDWDETLWALHEGYGTQTALQRHVVAMDFGAKHNILRCLAGGLQGDGGSRRQRRRRAAPQTGRYFPL